MTTIYDITRTISPTTAVWEGDTAYSVKPLLSITGGSTVNLTTLTMSAHTGTHADAPFHYHDAGEKAAQLPLSAYIGKALVVSVPKTSGLLTVEDFARVNLVGGERLLIHTPMSELGDDVLAKDFAALSVELIEHLAGLGYVLIGTDAISVDPYTSKTLGAHHALRRYDILNLESITLVGVPDGVYELIALPLKLEGACASPVRAILRTF
jgi:arylformamidase